MGKNFSPWTKIEKASKNKSYSDAKNMTPEERLDFFANRQQALDESFAMKRSTPESANIEYDERRKLANDSYLPENDNYSPDEDTSKDWSGYHKSAKKYQNKIKNRVSDNYIKKQMEKK